MGIKMKAERKGWEGCSKRIFFSLCFKINSWSLSVLKFVRIYVCGCPFDELWCESHNFIYYDVNLEPDDKILAPSNE